MNFKTARQWVLDNCFVPDGTKFQAHDVCKRRPGYEEYLKFTNYLPKDILFRHRVIFTLNGWEYPRKCPYCKCDIVDDFKNKWFNFKIFCSRSCAGSYKMDQPVIREKMAETNLSRYGHKFVMQSPICLEKSLTTRATWSTEYKNQIYSHTKFYHKSEEVYNILSSKEQMEKLYENFTIKEIGEKLGIAFSTVNNWLIRHDIDRTRPHDFSSNGEENEIIWV